VADRACSDGANLVLEPSPFRSRRNVRGVPPLTGLTPAVLTNVTSSYGVFPLVRRLARLG